MAGDEDQPLKAPEAAGDGREEELEDQAARLPGDVLADILGRVPRRSLAASRCVCKDWRDAVDSRRLLRADLLPLSLAGLFVHYNEHKLPEFLARPSSSSSVAGARAISGDLSFVPSVSPDSGYYYEDPYNPGDYDIEDHCNGLLLLHSNCVVNPATRLWNTLPTSPAKSSAGNVEYCVHLVYDPMVSPYYEVFQIPTLGNYHRGAQVDPSMEESEWPPSLCKMYVFSSKSGCWEEKDFLREGDAAGTVGEVRAGYSKFTAAYYRGALYVHCKTDFLMRVSLSDNTYRVIKPPMGLKVEGHEDISVARSEKGVYFVAFDGCWSSEKWWLRVWILNESCGQMEWSLKHEKDLKHMLPRQCFRARVKWVLEDINYNLFRASSSPEVNKRATTEEKFEWNSHGDAEGKDIVGLVENKLELNSNNDSALNDGGTVEDCYWDESRYDGFCHDDIELLGIHPYKEIVFLSASQQTCLAYHLNDSKIEELGNIYPKEYESFKWLVNERELIKSFPYTPCWIEEFAGNN